MKPQAEAKDLETRPLPVEPATAEDAKLPTAIFGLDVKISTLKLELESLEERRGVYMQRALSLGIVKDTDFEIVRKEKNLPRKINTDAFHDKHPNEYALAVAIENNDKIQAVINALQKIDLTDNPNIKVKTAQALLGERMVDDICYPHEIAVTYEVVGKTKLVRK